MSDRSVSGVWEDLLKEDGAYSVKGAGKDLIQKTISSRWISGWDGRAAEIRALL